MILALIMLISTPIPTVEGSWSGKWLHADWKAEAQIGGRVHLDLSTTSGTELRRVIACKTDWWPDDTHPKLLPTVTVREIGANRALVFTTYGTPSGVYGYREIVPYRIISQGRRLRIERIYSKGSLDFSDFGSWSWDSNRRELRIWDMYYQPDQEAHSDPHLYQLRRFAIRDGQFTQIAGQRTKRKYHVYWSLGDKDPPIIEPKGDPLREFGLKWKWWGQP